MKMPKVPLLLLFCLFALFILAGWSLRQPAAADRPVKIHIFYSSDALGYHEPCG